MGAGEKAEMKMNGRCEGELGDTRFSDALAVGVGRTAGGVSFVDSTSDKRDRYRVSQTR